MKKPNIYKRYQLPSVIIQYAVWLYYRFNLSLRDIEDLLAERGISVSYETIRSRIRFTILPNMLTIGLSFLTSQQEFGNV